MMPGDGMLRRQNFLKLIILLLRTVYFLLYAEMMLRGSIHMILIGYLFVEKEMKMVHSEEGIVSKSKL